ncbi:MAG: hypothetical protein PUK70_04950 [Bacteroidales bacterium]|nr:hypothetical protein [Bacteroidales bacterium]
MSLIVIIDTIKKAAIANNIPAMTAVRKSVWKTYNATILGIAIAEKPILIPILKVMISLSGAIALLQLSQIIECL